MDLALQPFLFLLWIYLYTVPMLTESARKEAQEKQQVLDTPINNGAREGVLYFSRPGELGGHT